MPVVLMVPLTVLSLLILMVPVAVADVVTGGVSSAPVKLTLTVFPKAAPLPTVNAAEWKRVSVCRFGFVQVGLSPLVPLLRPVCAPLGNCAGSGLTGSPFP